MNKDETAANLISQNSNMIFCKGLMIKIKKKKGS